MGDELTQSQRAMQAARLVNVDKSSAGRFPLMSPEERARCVTVEDAAASVGVHRTLVTTAKRMLREALPEVVAAVEDGRLSLHSARHLTVLVPREEQPEALAKALAAPRSVRGHVAISDVLSPDASRRRIDRGAPARPVLQQIERGIETLEHTSEIVLSLLPQAAAMGPEWSKRLRRVRRVVSRAIRQMER